MHPRRSNRITSAESRFLDVTADWLALIWPLNTGITREVREGAIESIDYLFGLGQSPGTSEPWHISQYEVLIQKARRIRDSSQRPHLPQDDERVSTLRGLARAELLKLSDKEEAPDLTSWHAVDEQEIARLKETRLARQARIKELPTQIQRDAAAAQHRTRVLLAEAKQRDVEEAAARLAAAQRRTAAVEAGVSPENIEDYFRFALQQSTRLLSGSDLSPAKRSRLAAAAGNRLKMLREAPGLAPTSKELDALVKELPRVIATYMECFDTRDQFDYRVPLAEIERLREMIAVNSPVSSSDKVEPSVAGAIFSFREFVREYLVF